MLTNLLTITSVKVLKAKANCDQRASTGIFSSVASRIPPLTQKGSKMFSTKIKPEGVMEDVAIMDQGHINITIININIRGNQI